MAKPLSPREVRKLKRDAEEFARTAKPGKTYYYLAEYASRYRGDGRPKHLLGEVVFGKPKRLYGPYPHWYATLTAYECYLKEGPLYADRNHPAIRGIETSREWQAEADARAEAIRRGTFFSKAAQPKRQKTFSSR